MSESEFWFQRYNDYNDYNEYNNYNDYNHYNEYNGYSYYNDYRDSNLDLDLDWERFRDLVTLLGNLSFTF